MRERRRKHSPAVRCARTIAMFLLLGAFATIAIAWAFALFGSIDERQFWNRPNTSDTPTWPTGTPQDWPRYPAGSEAWTGRGLRLDHATAHDSQHREYVLIVSRFGWPLLTLEYRWQAVGDASGQSARHSPSIPLPGWLDDFASRFTTRFPAQRRLPLVPIWPEFLISSAVFAAGFWVILRSRSAIRILLRKRRGQCTACGYPIGAGAVCSECGQPVA